MPSKKQNKQIKTPSKWREGRKREGMERRKRSVKDGRGKEKPVSRAVLTIPMSTFTNRVWGSGDLSTSLRAKSVLHS